MPEQWATHSTLARARFHALRAAQQGNARHVEFIVQRCDGLASAIKASADTLNTAKQ